MSDNSEWIEKRACPRVPRRFIVRARRRDGDMRWEMPTLKDISLAGCYFFSGTLFKVDDVLEIYIQLPVLERPMRFIGVVRRIEPQSKISMTQCGVGIQFIEMEESQKAKFAQIIDFTLKRQQGT